MSTATILDKESLSNRIANLSPEKREFLNKLLRAKAVDSSGLSTIQRRQPSDSVPLSFAQQRLWVLHQLEPEDPSYNMHESVRMQGPLDVAILERSLNEIIRRHEVLRTTFASAEQGPVQIIAPSQSIRLQLDDLSDLPEQAREAQSTRLASEEALRPFDLTRGPILRVKLLRLAESDHIILFTTHHIASDVWSMVVLVREVMALYNAFSQGKPSPLPELPIQYADFAVWQRESLQGDALKKQLDYWKEQLSGAPSVLELPTDRPRPAAQSFHGASCSFTLPGDLSSSILSLARRENVTLFMMMLTAFQVLLHRYTGEPDIVTGTPLAGRNRAETENLIGFFVNTLVLRANLSGDPTFTEVLAQVREVALGATAHQDLPFEQLVEELKPKRSFSHSPIFQVMFALQNIRGEAMALTGLNLLPVSKNEQVSKFDLTLFLSEGGGVINGSFDYKTDLFDRSTIERMVERFEQMLKGIVANPAERISKLPLLTDAEHHLIESFNDTRIEFANDICINDLFQRQAGETPEAVAVFSEGKQLNYEELNRQANQVARLLCSLGIGPDVPVGLCVERSTDMIVGLLGILKAGGAYVPMAPAYPKERLAYMLEDSRIPLLLTQEHLLGQFPAHCAQIVCLDRDWPLIAQQGYENLSPQAGPANLAYIIYTSGSTGKPKGVGIEHRQIVNYLNAVVERMKFTECKSFAMVQPLTFDSCKTVLYSALCTGGVLHVVSHARATDAQALGNYFSHHQIDCVKITPSHMAALLAAPHPEKVLPRRRLILGGEPSRTEWIQEIQTIAPGCAIFNHYGPTETTVGALTYCAKANQPAHTLTLPLERPLANLRAYILDPRSQLAHIGVAGELCIGGEGLARGYLNRPELTAEKFMPDPFSKEPGKRIYRTGDHARYLSNGTIEFVGRVDNQAKIRGFRVELGEVQAVLSQHPAIRESVVISKEDSSGDKRLVAYAVAESGEAPTMSELRSFMKEKLPDYMVPSTIVLLDALPLTSSGKLDHRALPDADSIRPVAQNAYVSPRTLHEIQITEIWEDILELRPIGVTDNFFDIGGHSIRALRVMARIQSLYGVELPLSTLFEGGTIEHLANIISKKIDVTNTHMVTIQAGGSKRPLFFMHPIGGGVACYTHLARHLGSERPVFGLQALEFDDPNFQVETMAASYIAEMRKVQPRGPYLLGGWSFGAYVALEVAQQLKQAGDSTQALIILDCGLPGWDRATQPKPEELDVDEDPVKLLRLLESFHHRNEPVPIAEDYLRQLSQDDQFLYIMDQAKEARIIPQEVTLDQVKRSLRNFRSRETASRNYMPQSYAGAINLFRSSEPYPAYKKYLDTDPAWAWNRITDEPVEVQIVPGNHLSMMAEPNVRVLAERVRALIDSPGME